MWAGLLVYLLYLVMPTSLKVAGYLPYSWWWVLLALWLPSVLLVAARIYVVFGHTKKGRRV